MKTIPAELAPSRVAEIADILKKGGLVCMPLRGTYRLLADARSEEAVLRVLQSKRRARNRPSLLLVPDLASAASVVDGTTWGLTKRLTARLWPGPLTLVLPPSEQLPNAVRKVLARSTGKIGVRVPSDPLALSLVRAVGAPLFASSANIERKPGASSASVVRQRFVHTIDLWIDAGDIAPEAPSTILDVAEASWSVVRSGAISAAEIERAAQR